MNFWPVDQPCTQLWYADDSSASGDIPSDHHSSLGLEIGLKYGYFPEPSKSHLIVTESLVECAKTIFKDTSVNVVTSHRFLGSIVGDDK